MTGEGRPRAHGTAPVPRPLVLDLADPAAQDLATTGGKGASLARLSAAGLPVPTGFHISTHAYREALAGTPERVIHTAVATADPDRPDTVEDAAERIAAVFARLTVPPRIADAVRLSYDRIDAAVAVRSSATAEDLPDLSFAGQQESYLNITGTDSVLRAVVDCWASLWSPRAIVYRARAGIPHDDVAIAVVVQRLVDADASGVLFTADPVTGSRDHVVVNAAWGLGESVVSGAVTPDTFTISRADGAVDSSPGSKTVRSVRHAGSVRTEPVPEHLRAEPSLTNEQVSTMAGLGVRIESLYDTPIDVEWALEDGEPWILQARPVTATGAARAVVNPPEEWNDTRQGDFLWTNANLGEAIPSVMTPLTWSLVQIFMSNAMASGDIGVPLYGNIGGRFYLNLSVTATVSRALGLTRMMESADRDVFGRLPGDIEAPVLPMSRWRIVRTIVPTVLRNVSLLRADIRNVEPFLRRAEERGTRLRRLAREANASSALASLWRDELGPYLIESSRALRGAGKQDGNALVLLRRDLRTSLGEAETDALTSGLASNGLASLDPLLRLRDVARGDLDRETYVRRFGHRCADEFEVSAPRPAEDPDWLARQLDTLVPEDVDALIACQDEAREAAWGRLSERGERRASSIRRRLERWARSARDREATRSEVVRTFWALREFAVRAGDLTGLGDDVYHLRIDELTEILDGGSVPHEAIASRRKTYETYRGLPPYPAVIRGHFDPVRWAADPGRRIDLFDGEPAAGGTARRHPANRSDVVRGLPGSAGSVEGVARVVSSVDDADDLLPGEILVTTVTNVGWTLVFPRVAAVVTDTGAPLSHAAIVARELGIPAVVGCGDATTRIRSGDRLRVDGELGTVTID